MLKKKMKISNKIFSFTFLLVFFIIFNSINKKNVKENINILSIEYELTYNSSYFIKVVILTHKDLLSPEIKFNALLKSERGTKEYNLSCHNTSKTSIECLPERNTIFDLQERYYFYYKRKENDLYIINNKEIFKDNKNVSLIFKPYIYKNQIMYKNYRKIYGKNSKISLGGGYLYIIPNNKKILLKPKDGFNINIDKNNFISRAGLYSWRPQSTYAAFKEAIRRGFRMVDADIMFTKDKIPVIFHGDDISKDSNGRGKIYSLTFSELKKFDFGKKYSPKFKGEKLLSFEKLLQLCKKNDVIIDLDLQHLDYKKYFSDTDEYLKIIINTVEKYDMMNSIIFNNGVNPYKTLILKKIRNDISVSIATMNTIQKINKVKNKYKGSKRIIMNMSNLSYGKNIDEKTVKYALSLGFKVKAAVVDNLKFAEKLQSWGVNYITTNKLHPFYMKNDYEEPILLKCKKYERLVECTLDSEINLIDNQIYNIYYSKNIYQNNKDIDLKSIGEFKYLENIKYKEYHYDITYLNITEMKLQINSTVKIKKGEDLFVSIGPKNYDNVAECYLHYFLCKGNNSFILNCSLRENLTDRVNYEGNYSIYKIEYPQKNIDNKINNNIFFPEELKRN